jgi:hypothetical protein
MTSVVMRARRCEMPWSSGCWVLNANLIGTDRTSRARNPRVTVERVDAR